MNVRLTAPALQRERGEGVDIVPATVTVEAAQNVLAGLLAERERLRTHGGLGYELEANRLAIGQAHRELAKCVIARQLAANRERVHASRSPGRFERSRALATVAR